MSEKVLEEITFKEDNFIRVRDGSKVSPKPLGNPQAFVALGFDELYSENEIQQRVVMVARKQRLIDKANAYAAKQGNLNVISNKDPILAIQLYKI